MSQLIKKLASEKVSRREFLARSAAATAAMAGLSLFGGTQNRIVKAEEEASVTHPEPVNNEADGTWISAGCWHGCGCRCMNKVLVNDGVVLRQKTDDTHEDSLLYPQQRSCPRGHSQQKQCFGAERLKYPMKRKHWEPGTGGDRQLRGRDEWERISWDEAFELVAKEITRIVAEYGNGSVLVPGKLSAFGGPFMNALGGHLSIYDSCSYGATLINTTAMGIPFGNVAPNDRLDLKNAEYVVLNGANPSWSTHGVGNYTLMNAVQDGVKVVYIGPAYNASAMALNAKWIPVYPGTDTAFFIGVAYEMVQAGVVDYEFLNKYTVGFDADHMPADARLDENFLGYLKGEYDGIVKDAAWASRISGASVEDIRFLAEVMGKDHDVTFVHGLAPARINGGENYLQTVLTVGLMGGHVGKPGNCVTCGADSYSAFNGGARLVNNGNTGIATFNPLMGDQIPGPDAWEAVLTGSYMDVGNGYVGGTFGGTRKECDVHALFCETNDDYLATGPNLNKGIEAFRKVDFVCARGFYMTTTCMYADIVLPITTQWEAVGNFGGTTNKEWINVYTQVTAPLFEAKSDQEINEGLLKACGIEPSTVYYLSERAQFFNQIYGCNVIKEDGSYEPLVTITEEDIKSFGIEAELPMLAAVNGAEVTPREGKIGCAEFLANGGYQVPRTEDDTYFHIQYKEFVEDPEAHPLTSASGKFEIYCQVNADQINSVALSDLEIKPYPSYITPISGYEHTFKDRDLDGEKSEYPYVSYNPHVLNRVCTVFDNNEWLRESFADPMWISVADAKEKGIENGDTVLVWNQYGKMLRRASVFAGMMPGVVGIPFTARPDIDEETGIDRAGNTNTLIGAPGYGMGVSGYNNIEVNFEKYDGEPIPANVDRPLITFEM